MQVQTGIPESGIEGFHKSILSRFARLDEMQFDPGIPAPEKHRFTRHFLPIVPNQHLGQATRFSQLLQEPRDTGSGNRQIHELADMRIE